MNNDFPRIITLLRTESGKSQKQTANDLGISQPLLSHYEKGIRECGLDFVVKVADYYNVSCDFLLGRTTNRNGGSIIIADVPDEADAPAAAHQHLAAAVNRKLITNSLIIIFDRLERLNNKGLINECSIYLMSAVYMVFRSLYSSNPRNPQGMFSYAPHIYKGRAHALQVLSESNIENLCTGMPIAEYKGLERTSRPEMSPAIIEEQYSELASSLFSLVQNVEERL